MNKSLRSKGVKLLDAVKHHLKYPETFEIPSEDEILDIRIGYYVKLIFIPLSGITNSEKMWVKVDKINEGHFKGTLSNTPFSIASLNFGDVIEFNSSNIISIIIPTE